MELHADTHLGAGAKERESVDTLQSMFESVSCFLMPSPGKTDAAA